MRLDGIIAAAMNLAASISLLSSTMEVNCMKDINCDPLSTGPAILTSF